MFLLSWCIPSEDSTPIKPEDLMSQALDEEPRTLLPSQHRREPAAMCFQASKPPLVQTTDPLMEERALGVQQQRAPPAQPCAFNIGLRREHQKHQEHQEHQEQHQQQEHQEHQEQQQLQQQQQQQQQ
eukprot:CAMPEP_0115418906 /NCGR_PEP_ID=MMETSP0271-20121206/24912_1 /TAXON_ID=71861 /ORGANISM="Scrippsiella trochoidea, Strain CCMP3099" /LENGTH=126 /DNA_ID=CAMNT_0002843401 /DNA_START=60 /DNA_END=437 /DNA_ORIENTATION=+